MRGQVGGCRRAGHSDRSEGALVGISCPYPACLPPCSPARSVASISGHRREAMRSGTTSSVDRTPCNGGEGRSPEVDSSRPPAVVARQVRSPPARCGASRASCRRRRRAAPCPPAASQQARVVRGTSSSSSSPRPTAYLQVLVVRAWQALGRDEQRNEAAHDAPCLAAQQLERVCSRRRGRRWTDMVHWQGGDSTATGAVHALSCWGSTSAA